MVDGWLEAVLGDKRALADFAKKAEQRSKMWGLPQTRGGCRLG